jgi:hypothetical protein
MLVILQLQPHLHLMHLALWDQHSLYNNLHLNNHFPNNSLQWALGLSILHSNQSSRNNCHKLNLLNQTICLQTWIWPLNKQCQLNRLNLLTHLKKLLETSLHKKTKLIVVLHSLSIRHPNQIIIGNQRTRTNGVTLLDYSTSIIWNLEISL